jgi:hypothetical protein
MMRDLLAVVGVMLLLWFGLQWVGSVSVMDVAMAVEGVRTCMSR